MDASGGDGGARLLESLESSSKDPGAMQQELLKGIIQQNACCDYLRRYGTIRENRGFRENVPIVVYEDVKDDINRIADGETGSVLCVDPIAEMFTSSGTSGGEHKLFPRIKGDSSANSYFDLASALLNRELPGLDDGKALNFLYVRKPKTTRGGLPAYPALTGYYNSVEFLNNPRTKTCTSPIEVILYADSVQASYCHLLCGLIHSEEVRKLGSFFASAFVRSIRCLETWWKDLCKDISTGVLSDIVTEPRVRKSVEKLLKPNPELADSIHRACSPSTNPKSQWKGIIRRLWPRAKVIDTVVTGTMLQYVGAIEFLSDGLPIASTIYGASETYLGVNLKPLCPPSQVSYMLLPETAYYEFLPLSHEVPDNKQLKSVAVEINDVELGEEYELVVTTKAGLYRYRMGDVLKVSGFHNKAPLFSFVCRRNVLLSIDSDKTGEQELHAAVSRAVQLLQSHSKQEVRLVDYSSYAELSTNPPHYVIFWELSLADEDLLQGLDAGQLEEACFAMEESLSVVYHRGRAEKSIAPLELRLLNSGAFDKLADHVTAKGGSIAQFKTPRCIKDPSLSAILSAAVCRRFTSPKAPAYA